MGGDAGEAYGERAPPPPPPVAAALLPLPQVTTSFPPLLLPRPPPRLPQVSYIAKCGWSNGCPVDGRACRDTCRIGTGGLAARLNAGGFYNGPWGPAQDQNPMFVVAVHAVAVATGDAAWLRRLLPALGAVAVYLEAGGVGAGGLFRAPNSGLSGSSGGGSNW